MRKTNFSPSLYNNRIQITLPPLLRKRLGCKFFYLSLSNIPKNLHHLEGWLKILCATVLLKSAGAQDYFQEFLLADGGDPRTTPGMKIMLTGNFSSCRDPIQNFLKPAIQTVTDIQDGKLCNGATRDIFSQIWELVYRDISIQLPNGRSDYAAQIFATGAPRKSFVDCVLTEIVPIIENYQYGINQCASSSLLLDILLGGFIALFIVLSACMVLKSLGVGLICSDSFSYCKRNTASFFENLCGSRRTQIHPQLTLSIEDSGVQEEQKIEILHSPSS